MEDYVGKICPFCKTEIKESDTVKVCPSCNIPHHADCWKENDGCTTFGCSEKKTDRLPDSVRSELSEKIEIGVKGIFEKAKLIRNSIWGFGLFTYIITMLFYARDCHSSYYHDEEFLKLYSDDSISAIASKSWRDGLDLMDKDLVLGLSIAILLSFFLIGLIYYLWVGKNTMLFDGTFVSGKASFGKTFSISKENIKRVTEAPFSGLTFTDIYDKKYTVKFLKNRDSVVKELKDKQIEVYNSPSYIDDSVCESVKNVKKLKRLK